MKLFFFLAFLSFIYADGALLFAKNCSSCHGQNGEKPAFAKTSALTKLSADQILNRVKSYRSDPNFGKSAKILMQIEAKKISNSDLKEIIKFLKGEDSLKSSTFFEDENTDIKSTPTNQGIYLK